MAATSGGFGTGDQTHEGVGRVAARGARRFGRVGGLLAGAAVWMLAAVGAPRPASALTLGDLVGGSGFTTANGLQFSGFHATFSGSLAPDPSLYSVAVLPDGFRLSGAFSAADGEVGDLLLTYDVAVANPSLGISDASLLFNGRAAGTGAQASVAEDLFSGATLVAPLFAYVTGGGGLQSSDHVAFGRLPGLHVSKDVAVDSRLLDPEALGGIAVISQVDQRFSVVLEPGVGLLLGFGLVGLGLFGRRAGKGGARA